MMIKKNLFLLAIVALMGLASCTSDVTEMSTEGTAGMPVRLTATSDISLTRAADGVHNAFAANDEVTVGMVNGTTTTAEVYTLGAPDGSGNSTLTVAAGSSELIYPNNDVTLTAVYPKESTTSHTVAADQISDAAYKTSDLLIANKAVAQSEMGQSQNLQFSHALTKFTVTISNPNGLSISAVKMKNVKRTVPLTTTSAGCTLDEATAATGTDISFGPASASTEASQTYACVFPAQSWSGNDFLTIETSAGTATYTLTTSAFTNGQRYALTINLSPLSLGQSTALTGWPGTGGGTITPGAVTGFTIAPIPAQAQTSIGSPVTPTVTVTNSASVTLTLGTDYTVSYYDNTGAGTAYVIVTGIGDYAGLTAVATFTIPLTAASISASHITALQGSDYAYVLCEDGYIHLCYEGYEVVEMVSEGTPEKMEGVIAADDHPLSCGKKKVAVVAYVGDVGRVDKSDGSSGYHGLALALTDAPEGTGDYEMAWGGYGSPSVCTVRSDNITTIMDVSYSNVDYWKGIDYTNKLDAGTCGHNDHVAAKKAKAYSLNETNMTSTPSTSITSIWNPSQWFLPTVAQWNLIMKGLFGGDGLTILSSNSDYNYSAMNRVLKAATGKTSTPYTVGIDEPGSNLTYWLSTEYVANEAWLMRFRHGSVGNHQKNNDFNVRPVLAF